MNISTKIKSLLMGAVASVGLLSVAAPSVEIVEAWQETPGSGIVNYSYQVGGFVGKTCDLQIKVGAKGATPQTVATSNVTVGTVTTNIDYKALLGHAYPNVTLYASLYERQGGGRSGAAVQLWKDGPYWATCNVGATTPEKRGYHFMWGNPVAYQYTGGYWKPVGGNGSSIAFSKGYCSTFSMNETQFKNAGILDASGNLSAAYDAATVRLGVDWRMPTDAEISALVQKCTTTWTDNWNGTGVAGRIVTGKGDYSENSIFLPVTGSGEDNSRKNEDGGYYWCSNISQDYTGSTSVLAFGSTSFSVRILYRYFGFTVRPVRKFAE